MGMYSFEIVPVQTVASTFEYGISVVASPNDFITTNEVLQFTLNDTFTNVSLTPPENTTVSYEQNVVTWQIDSLNAIPLVLTVNAEHPVALEEGDIIASAITNTFLNDQGEEITQSYEDFTFNPPLFTPEFRLDISLKHTADCVYTLEFKATNLSDKKALTNVSYTYMLDSNFEWQSPLNDPSFTSTTWTIDTLAPNDSATKTAIIKYIGTVSVDDKTIFSSIDGTAKYDTNKNATYKGVYIYEQDVDPCPQIPCCEKCSTPVPVYFGACEQSQPASVTAAIDSDGREIKVKIQLTNLCKNKTVVVGLELFEGKPTDLNPVRKVLRVVQLSRKTGDVGCAPFECDCVTFFIPGPICSEQYFFIKAQAHYFNATPSTCSCTCPTV